MYYEQKHARITTRVRLRVMHVLKILFRERLSVTRRLPACITRVGVNLHESGTVCDCDVCIPVELPWRL